MQYGEILIIGTQIEFPDNKSTINKSNMELINHYIDESIKSLDNIISYEDEINQAMSEGRVVKN